MIRKSSLKDQILTALVLAADVLGAAGETVPVKNRYRMLYGMLGATASSPKGERINIILEELSDEGLIKKNRSEVPYLTSAGQQIKRRLLREQKRDWDGKWRMVFFDIPEKRRLERDALRRELLSLGFGPWQRSCWIIPFDVTAELAAYLRAKKLTKNVDIFVGERVGEIGDREFAASVWPIEQVNKKYDSLLRDWNKELRRESSSEQRQQVIFRLQRRFLSIFSDDPHLPPALLPADWKGEEARKLYGRLVLMSVPLQ